MKRYLVSLCLLLGAAGAASAGTALLNFADPTQNANATLVSNADGKVTNVTASGRTAVQTGGKEGNQYLYIDVKDDLLKDAKVIYVRVVYLDEGTDQWQLEYNSESDPATLAQPVRYKADTQAWTQQTFKIVDANLTGMLDGKADIRINDLADGPEIISSVTITDQDPDVVQFPKVDPAHPIVIDGVKNKDEWNGALAFTLDKGEYDVIQPTMWTSKEDFSGIYSYKWSDQGLYVFGEVTDATPRLNDSDAPYYNGDGLEQFISLDWSDPSHTAYIVGVDYHLFIGMGDTPKWANQFDPDGNGRMNEDRGEVPATNLTIVKADQGYNFELLIPWSFMNKDFKPKDDQLIGWYMFANNSTVTPSAQEMALSPFKRNGPSGNPSRWATAVLSKSLIVENPPAGP